MKISELTDAPDWLNGTWGGGKTVRARETGEDALRYVMSRKEVLVAKKEKTECSN